MTTPDPRMPDMTAMNGRELAAIIRERVLRDMFPAPDKPTYTYIHPKWPQIWAELRARCGPAHCVFIIVITVVLWPVEFVWSLFRWFVSKPAVKAILAAAILGGAVLWFWSWLGLLVACLFVWLFTLFRQNHKSRPSEEEAGRQKTPSATARSLGESEQEDEHRQEQKDEYLIAVTHHESPFKHIPGQPWGDPSFYVRPSTQELKQGQDALNEREAEKREHEEALKRQEAGTREYDEARERESREFLNREAERVLKEREEKR
jgi:hypothetical protein